MINDGTEVGFLKSRKLCKFIIIALSFVLMLSGAVISYTFSVYRIPPLTDSELEASGINNATKLMIVAHPDDDMIWGGGHLMEKGYFVVVVTNRTKTVRKKEFYDVLEATGNDGIILSYPDKTFGRRDSWEHNRDDIIRDLEKVICYHDWELIVTHNANGEYGHQHHKMTHRFVTDIFKEHQDELKSQLYFFGNYYTANEIDRVAGLIPRITDKQLAFKEDILKLYKSQSKVVKNLSHMNPFENWILYDGTNG